MNKNKTTAPKTGRPNKQDQFITCCGYMLAGSLILMIAATVIGVV